MNTTNPMTVEEFFNRCKHFDWYYTFSDDHRVWCAGEAARVRLEQLAKSNWVFQNILNAWVAHKYSGQSFGKPKVDEPKLETFQ